MTIGDYATHFAGQPIINWNVDEEELDTGQQELDPNTTVYRISVNSWESEISWSEAFAAFLNAPGAAKTTGLVIGTWDFEPDIQQGGNEAARIVEALATARDRLPNLTAIFFGDILSLDSEISWIQQTDVSPLFEAYPALQEFRVRGGNGLRFGRLHHESLKTLIVETGG
ncbi:MAG: hypothetical protein J2P36_28785, partial [Ktedonobacteraceae bacterium]|nr:hypothetical protein [Ktedonobacteraceae bacterium]